MQTVLFDSLQTALRDYFLFLLAFALRDKELFEKPLIKEMTNDFKIQLGLGSVSVKGDCTNDLDLIKL